ACGRRRGERWSGFWAESVIRRAVRDAAALLDVTAGQMPGDPYTAPPPAMPYAEAVRTKPGRLRVGIMRHAPRGLPLDPECLASVDRTARVLTDLGHVVEESHPEVLDEHDGVMHFVTIVSANIARALEGWGARLGRTLGAGDVEITTWSLAERGRATSAADLLATLEYSHAFGRRVAAWWESGFDLLITP